MGKRGVIVWIFSSLSFLAAIHALEASLALFLNTETLLLKSYPVINTLTMSPTTYLLASTALTIAMWGITCKVAVETPVERFLNTMLSDAKMQSELECEIVDDNRSVLDMMCETMTENNKVLAQTRDVTFNVRSELVNLRSLPEETERLSKEVEGLKKELKKLKENFKKPNLCPSCGNTVLPRFKVCPYCGENLHITPEKAVKMLQVYK
jgi:rubrerythrin